MWENVKELNQLCASSAFLNFIESLSLLCSNSDFFLHLSYYIHRYTSFIDSLLRFVTYTIQANSAFFSSLFNNYLSCIFQVVVIFPMRYLEKIQYFWNPKYWIALSMLSTHIEGSHSIKATLFSAVKEAEKIRSLTAVHLCLINVTFSGLAAFFTDLLTTNFPDLANPFFFQRTCPKLSHVIIGLI